MVESLIGAMEEAVAALKRHPSRRVTLFHHNDTDGLSAGAILLHAFEETGYDVDRFSLEKPYPQVLEEVFRRKDEILLFADFAGRIAPLIASLNDGRNLVIILDHHPAERAEDAAVFNLDGELYGLKGDRDISASATCFLFSGILLGSCGLPGDSLAHLGVLGAVGDGFLVDGCLSGVNRQILRTAQKEGSIRVDRSEAGEIYHIRLGGREYAATDICTILDTVGGVGYYDDGASKGISICRSGLDARVREYADELEKRKDAVFAREIDRLRENIRTTEHLQWFNVEDRFQSMGVKMIGVFCTLIKDRDFLDQTKYLAGFQTVPNDVPGFGPIDLNAAKISMRASGHLTEKIRSGQVPGLDSFLPEATKRLGGFSDACHGLSAATTVSIGREQSLIDEMERLLTKRMGNNG